MDPRNQRGAIGPLVGLVIILGIILAGGVYFYTTIKTGNKYAPNAQTEQTQNVSAEEQGAELDMNEPYFPPQSTSTTPSDIERDLNTVNVDTVNSININP